MKMKSNQLMEIFMKNTNQVPNRRMRSRHFSKACSLLLLGDRKSVV